MEDMSRDVKSMIHFLNRRFGKSRFSPTPGALANAVTSTTLIRSFVPSYVAHLVQDKLLFLLICYNAALHIELAMSAPQVSGIEALALACEE